ncbi:15941_t:CDS:2 [Funneliformis mosseae]|uniref:15941_t:CDS:1 n=1 Tax=Funneliformis mosseae TaxID=27381 RepID=A0A9N9N5V9_FUNMO|nr:15941_t:CDS:2 [Funneliformis mosseae]
MVNAIPHQLRKRGSNFGECPVYKGVKLPLISVKLNPDPVQDGKPEHFDVSGTLDVDIPASAILNVYYADPNKKTIIGDVSVKPMCTDNCPIKAKTEFKVSDDTTTPSLTDPYAIIVAVTDDQNVLGCAALSTNKYAEELDGNNGLDE